MYLHDLGVFDIIMVLRGSDETGIIKDSVRLIYFSCFVTFDIRWRPISIFKQSH
jgi:hypothetical protein